MVILGCYLKRQSSRKKEAKDTEEVDKLKKEMVEIVEQKGLNSSKALEKSKEIDKLITRDLNAQRIT